MKSVLIALFAFSLTACGGGGGTGAIPQALPNGGDSTNVVASNNAPGAATTPAATGAIVVTIPTPGPGSTALPCPAGQAADYFSYIGAPYVVCFDNQGTPPPISVTPPPGAVRL